MARYARKNTNLVENLKEINYRFHTLTKISYIGTLFKVWLKYKIPVDSDCYSMPTQWFFSYIMAIFNEIMSLVAFLYC
jgi:hypothetical protein